MMLDNVAIEPKEKSNLPELRFIESAKVVIVVEAVDITNIAHSVEEPISVLCENKQIRFRTTTNKRGMIMVPNVFLPIVFILFLLTIISSKKEGGENSPPRVLINYLLQASTKLV